MSIEMMTEALGASFAIALDKMDPSQEEKIIAAFWLCRKGHVTIAEDKKSFLVKSQTTETKYITTYKTCNCPFGEHQKADSTGRCKHMYAVMLTQRAQERCRIWHAQIDETEAAKALAEGLESATLQAVPSQAMGLGEARISISMKGTVQGVKDTMVTFRGDNMEEIREQANEYRSYKGVMAGIFDPPQAEQARERIANRQGQSRRANEEEAPYCDDHGCYWKKYTAKDGSGRTWYSHKIQGTDQWCKYE